MTAPTSADLAAAIVHLEKAAGQLQDVADLASGAIQAAVTEVEEAAGKFDLNELADQVVTVEELAEEIARLHDAEHEGSLRFCERLVCRMADEVRS